MNVYAQTLHGRPFYVAGLEITPELREYEVSEDQASELRSMAKTATTTAGTPLLRVTDKRSVARNQGHVEADNAALAAEVEKLK